MTSGEAARRPLEARDLYRLRLISDTQISPDGDRVAFVLKQLDEKKNEYAGNIFVADSDGSVTQFTNGDKDWGPRWSPNGKFLAFVSGRKEKAQVHMLSLRGGESVALTTLPFGAGLPVWSPDSTRIVFTGVVSTDPEEADEERDKAKAENEVAKTKVVDRSLYKTDGAGYIGNRRRHLFLIDVATREVRQVTEGDFHDDNPCWSPDGALIAFSSSRSPRWDVALESDIYVMPGSGGEALQLVSGGKYGRPAFSPDGNRIAFFGHRDPEDMFAPGRIYSADSSGAGLRDELSSWDGNAANVVVSDIVLSAEEHAPNFTWDAAGIYFLGTHRGETNIYCADGEVRSVTRGKHAIIDFSITCDRAIAYARADATHPAEVFVQIGDQVNQLTHENDTFLEQVCIATPERVGFIGAEGEESEGWLIPPRGFGAGKHPLIVYIHGGPMLAHGEALVFEYQLLASEGFGVFYPNLHGSASYGREYQISIKEDWGNLDYQDVLAGTKEAAARPWVDGERIGIAGGSYGGYMTNWAITHGNQFRAAITERCLCNITSFMGTSDSGSIWNHMFGVYPEQDVQNLWAMSPIKDVEKVQAAVLVIHSERDDRTPLEQGEQMFNALRRLGKVTRLIMFPDESHGLSRIGKPSRRIERLEHVVGWFKKYL